jgi:Protein of unknown function (DUF3142)
MPVFPQSKKGCAVVGLGLIAPAIAGLIVVSHPARRSSPTLGSAPTRSTPNNLPRVMLWAWERPEDLRFIEPRQVGVAFLARTVFLSGNNVFIRPRLQPLAVAPGTVLAAVVRIESSRAQPPTLSEAQRIQAVRAIAVTADLTGVSAVQVDFDATASERKFYRSMLEDLRKQLSSSTSLSITALASWCLDDDWLEGLPIDDAVPMLFRMGPDRHNVLLRLDKGKDFRATLCRQSAGISTDEPLPPLPPGRRIYVFRPKAWSSEAMQAVFNEVRP